jgi:hypothetical protein
MLGKLRKRAKNDAFGETVRNTRELAERHSELSAQIASLESFICEAPARAAEMQLDRMQTIPPPEVFDGVPQTSTDEPVRLSRSQVAQIKAIRRRNMIVFLCAATAFGAFAHWLSQVL